MGDFDRINRMIRMSGCVVEEVDAVNKCHNHRKIRVMVEVQGIVCAIVDGIRRPRANALLGAFQGCGKAVEMPP